MRIAFWIVFTIAVVLGALYGVGRFLLPNTLDVTRTANVARPPAAIFAMANDLRITREWSPYYARDPDADYSFSGEGPGPGQTMRWASNNREIGEGRMTIVRASENEAVDTILQLGDRATLSSRFLIRRAPRGSSVAWAVSAGCQETWINVPCRYMNLILQRSIERDLDQGLSRLRTLAEQLPDVDFAGLEAEMLNVSPQPFVSAPATTSATNQAEVDRALTMGIDQVRRFMTESNLTASGPLVRVTTDWNAQRQVMSFNVGYPFQGPAPLTVVGVQIGETPSGRAMRVIHSGPRSTMQQTYARAYAYLQAHRIPLRENGFPWEVVLSDEIAGDPNQQRIAIYIPLQ